MLRGILTARQGWKFVEFVQEWRMYKLFRVLVHDSLEDIISYDQKAAKGLLNIKGNPIASADHAADHVLYTKKAENCLSLIQEYFPLDVAFRAGQLHVFGLSYNHQSTMLLVKSLISNSKFSICYSFERHIIWRHWHLQLTADLVVIISSSHYDLLLFDYQ